MEPTQPPKGSGNSEAPISQQPPAHPTSGVPKVHAQLPTAPNSGRTAYYRAIVSDAIGRSDRRLKLLFGLTLLVLVLGGGVAAIVYIDHQDDENTQLRKSTEEGHAEQLKLAKKTETLNTALKGTQAELEKTEEALANSRKALEKLRTESAEAAKAASDKLAAQSKALEDQAKKLNAVSTETSAKLGAHAADLVKLKEADRQAESIAARYEKSLFMLILERESGMSGFCTGFAIDEGGVLATNAHCVKAMHEASEKGIRAWARMNKDPTKTYQIMRWQWHGNYGKLKTFFSPDVAVMRLDMKGQRLPVAVTLASDETLRGLATGSPVYTLGFPGQVMNPRRPVADFRADVISRMTTYGNTLGDYADNQMIWHSMLISKGTSGSPIFAGNGEVIAINAGSWGTKKVVVVDHKGKEGTRYMHDGSGLNWGIRIDAVRYLIPDF